MERIEEEMNLAEAQAILLRMAERAMAKPWARSAKAQRLVDAGVDADWAAEQTELAWGRDDGR